jgi:4-hydroxy-tetrahydrodipicolinate reductase
VAAQIEQAAAAGYAVVSSCEELTWPWARHPGISARLERRARAAGVAVFGTGVNPGFVMDLLPVILSGITRQVRHVHVRRVVDASTRRLPLQRKIGAGLTPARFRAEVRAGRLGHVGLPESAHMIAHALGWKCSRLTNRVEPVLARRAVPGPVPVAAGQVTGIDQRVVLVSGGREVIRLELTMALGAGPPHDDVAIQGTPPLHLRLEGGAPGDAATVAALIRGAFSVAAAPPGLWTPITIPFAARPEERAGRRVTRLRSA